MLIALQVAYRALRYGLAKPTREVLFTVLGREEKYKSKAFLDAAIYRGGDLASGWIFTGLKALGMSLGAIALVVFPLGWALGHALANGLFSATSPAELFDQSVRVGFNRFFGVLCLTLPIVMFVTGRDEPAPMPSRMPWWEWVLLAGYTLLRLPWEVKDLFREWLAEHFPDRAAHVMSVLRAMRGGRDNDPQFGTRMHATGPVAALLRQRFRLARRKLGYPDEHRGNLSTHLFRQPLRIPPQLSLDF